jgi:hypothetical protein
MEDTAITHYEMEPIGIDIGGSASAILFTSYGNLAPQLLQPVLLNDIIRVRMAPVLVTYTFWGLKVVEFISFHWSSF